MQKLKISPTQIISSSASNMNSVQSEKYSLGPDEIEKKYLSSERFRTLFNFHRIEITKLVYDRLDRYHKKKYKAKRRKLRENLNIGEKVLVLAERIKKKNQLLENFTSSLHKALHILIKKKYFLSERKKK